MHVRRSLRIRTADPIRHSLLLLVSIRCASAEGVHKRAGSGSCTSLLRFSISFSFDFTSTRAFSLSFVSSCSRLHVIRLRLITSCSSQRSPCHACAQSGMGVNAS
jgi:hypothetical protein